VRDGALEIGIPRVVAEGKLIPGAGQGAAAKGQARFADLSKGHGVIAVAAGPGTLDQPFQTIMVMCGLSVGASGLGIALEQESLAEPSLRIAVFWSGLEGQPEPIGRGLGIAFDQGEPAAETGQGASVVFTSTRTGAEQGLRAGRLAPVQRDPCAGDASLEISLGQRLERGTGLIQPAEPAETLGKGQP
jgi:hypothetical protein